MQQLFLAPPPLADALELHDMRDEGDGQATMLDQSYFHERKKGGFFIGEELLMLICLCYMFSTEAGAYNGWTGSNSLHFEAVHQWSGLLVEPVPSHYTEITETGRRVWASPSCLSTNSTSYMAQISIEQGVYKRCIGSLKLIIIHTEFHELILSHPRGRPLKECWPPQKTNCVIDGVLVKVSKY